MAAEKQPQGLYFQGDMKTKFRLHWDEKLMLQEEFNSIQRYWKYKKSKTW